MIVGKLSEYSFMTSILYAGGILEGNVKITVVICCIIEIHSNLMWKAAQLYIYSKPVILKQ